MENEIQRGAMMNDDDDDNEEERKDLCLFFFFPFLCVSSFFLFEFFIY